MIRIRMFHFKSYIVKLFKEVHINPLACYGDCFDCIWFKSANQEIYVRKRVCVTKTEQTQFEKLQNQLFVTKNVKIKTSHHATLYLNYNGNHKVSILEPNFKYKASLEIRIIN